jgi:Tfp pilus assembly protein PilN
MKRAPSLQPSPMHRWGPRMWGASWRPWPVRCVGLLCGLLAVSALAMALLQATQLKAQVEKVRGIVVQNELSTRHQDSTRTSKTSVVTPAQADAMNEVVDRLNIPWAHLLNDLESLTPPTVAVLQMEPLVAANALRWQVEAKSHQQVFTYLEKLRDAKTLKQARLIKFETNTQDPNRPIRFVLEAELVVERAHSAQDTTPASVSPPATRAVSQRASGSSP